MSTAKTSIGCLAEDYAMELALICADWLDAERSYYARHPKELDEFAQRHIDVADSFILIATSDE